MTFYFLFISVRRPFHLQHPSMEPGPVLIQELTVDAAYVRLVAPLQVSYRHTSARQLAHSVTVVAVVQTFT